MEFEEKKIHLICNFQVEQSTSVNQTGGSKRHHNGVLVNGTHYMRRVDPEHRYFPNGWDFFSNLPFTRVEGGHRVVDIDQDIFPVLNVEPRSSYQGITLEVNGSNTSQLLKCNTSP